MQIGFTELLLVGFLIIALIKPSKLREIASWIGALYRETSELKQDINSSILNTNIDVKEERGVDSNENGVS